MLRYVCSPFKLSSTKMNQGFLSFFLFLNEVNFLKAIILQKNSILSSNFVFIGVCL